MSAYEEGVERLEEIREASRVLWRTPDGMEVPVELMGPATWAWGRFNVKVRPVGGTGSKSVSLENLRGVKTMDSVDLDDPRYVDMDDERARLVAWWNELPMGGWTDDDEDAFRKVVVAQLRLDLLPDGSATEDEIVEGLDILRIKRSTNPRDP